MWGDGGWGRLVRKGKHAGTFDGALIEASVELIDARWSPTPRPEWVAFIPSARHPELVRTLAQALATALCLPCEDVLMRTGDRPPQKSMQDSPLQHANASGAFRIQRNVHPSTGAGPVFPFALATSAERSGR